jgi:TRAP-type C4-dicarboxylate transport system substrate-binding protein
MKMMTQTVAAGLLSGLLMAAPAVHAQTTLNASSWVPPAHLLTAKVMVPWMQEVEQATEGRVKFNMLPKAPVGPPQTFDAVRDGIVDLSFTVHGYTPGRFTLTKMTEFGFLGDSAESISVAYQRMFDKHLAAHNEHDGVKVIGVFSHGPGHIYSARHPVASLADLANMKIRVGGGVVNDYTRVLGANPLLKPSSESYQMLQTGVADGIFFPSESIEAFKLTGLLRHGTEVPGGLYNTSFVMMMNKAKFDALPPADQAAIERLSGEYFARLVGRAWDEADAAGSAAIRAAGVNVQTASPAFVDEIRAKIEPIERAWYDEIKAKGLDGAALMEEFRAEIRKVAAGG